MSPLMLAFLTRAGDSVGMATGDRVWAAEAENPRSLVVAERLVVGGIVDGGPKKPGVILCSLSSLDRYQEVDVPTIDQARAVMSALVSAWPELGCDETPAAGTPIGDGTVGE